MTVTGVSTNVQALLSNLSELVTVIAHAPADDQTFAGYPAACHYYAGTESNYATVSQNRRVIDYVVELYMLKDPLTTPETEFADMYALIDTVIDMFDQSMDLSSAELSLTRACDILRPAPGLLDRVETNEGVGLMAVIHLYCEADVTFR